jgi:hypothetical protein
MGSSARVRLVPCESRWTLKTCSCAFDSDGPRFSIFSKFNSKPCKMAAAESLRISANGQCLRCSIAAMKSATPAPYAFAVLAAGLATTLGGFAGAPTFFG